MIGWKPKSDDYNVASVRYRCLIPMKILRKRGVDIELFDINNLNKYEKVIFSKCYSKSDQKIAKIVQDRGGKVILDICDNHLYNPFGLERYEQAGQDLMSMITLADRIVCSTEMLAKEIAQQSGVVTMPSVVPDSIEMLPGKSIFSRQRRQLHRQINNPTNPGGIRLLWFGSHGSPNAPGGMEDILLISDQLDMLHSDVSIELWVVSNSREKFNKLIKPMPFNSRYFEWDHSVFRYILRSANAVIIPISKNPFTICKTHNRLSLALYNGVPVVADSIPSYEEFSPYCHLDSWQEGLGSVIRRDRDLSAKLTAAKQYLERNYNQDVIGLKWLSLVSEV